MPLCMMSMAEAKMASVDTTPEGVGAHGTLIIQSLLCEAASLLKRYNLNKTLNYLVKHGTFWLKA